MCMYDLCLSLALTFIKCELYQKVNPLGEEKSLTFGSFNSMNEYYSWQLGNKLMLKRESNIPGAIKLWIIVR